MKKEKIEIYSKDIPKVEEFLEWICAEYHIHNYLGSISVALSTAMSLTKGKIILVFQKDKEGVSFTLESEGKYFSSLTSEGKAEDESLFLIENLPDSISVKDEGKCLIMNFYVSGIEPEMALHRKEIISNFSLRKKKLTSIN
ncbi:MAG: hypothetical protein Q4Q06_01020 [Bacteroidota bacterium]|nr:hypothetical protein [Bacteroidota bacterium]